MTFSGMLLSWHKPRGHLCIEWLGLQDTEQQPLLHVPAPLSSTKVPMLSECEEPPESCHSHPKSSRKVLIPQFYSGSWKAVHCGIHHLQVAQCEHSVHSQVLLEPKPALPLGCFTTPQAPCSHSCSPAVSLNGEMLLRQKYCF